VRFFVIATLLRRWGDPVRVFIEKRLTLVTTALVLAVICGFLLLRYL
jgi:hypothetical protein